jgi:hypothetical protein
MEAGEYLYKNNIQKAGHSMNFQPMNEEISQRPEAHVPAPGEPS